MQLNTLINKLHDIHKQNSHSTEELNVVIKTSDPSLGPSSYVDISNIRVGFDWDSGKILIIPDEKLVKMKLNRDIPMGVHKSSHGYTCNRCDCFVDKKDKFCKHCGQKLIDKMEVKSI